MPTRIRVSSNLSLFTGLLVGLCFFAISELAAQAPPGTEPAANPGEIQAKEQVEEAPIGQSDQSKPDKNQQAQPVQEDEPNPAAQMSEMELMERVEELQRQLASQQIPERDAAEKELIQFGPIVLDLLDVSEEEISSDMTDRLGRIRKVLEKVAAKEATRPSKVSINGNLTIEEVFKKIKQQTRNDVGLMEGVPDQLADQKISLALESVEFWPAMKEIMKKSNLKIAPYSSGPGQLRLAPIAPAVDNTGAPIPAAKIHIPNDQAGIFDFQVTRIDSTRSLVAPRLNHSNLILKIRWEPRIRPISVELPLQQVITVDEFDKPVNVANAEAVVSGIVQPEIPELEFSIPLELVDRQIEELKLLEATIDAVLPGRIESFKFNNLGNLPLDTDQTLAGVIVGFGGIKKNEDLFGVNLSIGFEEENEATESYQGWIFQNRVFLIDGDGNEHEYIGMESGAYRDGRTGVLYYFDVDPADCSLVYQTPAAIVKMPIKIKLEKIPLP